MVLVSGVLEGDTAAFSPIGVAFGLIAALFYAVIVLCNKKVKNVSSYDTTFIQLLISALIVLPYVLLTEDGYCIIEGNASSGCGIFQMERGVRNDLLGEIYKSYGVIE